MRAALVLITGNSDLADRLGGKLDGNLVAKSAWPDHGWIPWDVLIVNVSSASPSIWEHLERLSHEQTRPSIILLDDGRAPCDHLARVAADDLIPLDATNTETIARIEEHTCDHSFREGAIQIKGSGAIPYPLARFLAAAFTERSGRVKTLARSLGLSQSTLRNPLAGVSIASVMRLENVLHRVAVLRKSSRTMVGDWRLNLQKLVGQRSV